MNEYDYIETKGANGFTCRIYKVVEKPRFFKDSTFHYKATLSGIQLYERWSKQETCGKVGKPISVKELGLINFLILCIASIIPFKFYKKHYVTFGCMKSLRDLDGTVKVSADKPKVKDLNENRRTWKGMTPFSPEYVKTFGVIGWFKNSDMFRHMSAYVTAPNKRTAYVLALIIFKQMLARHEFIPVDSQPHSYEYTK
jgi:hypothetical protein